MMQQGDSSYDNVYESEIPMHSRPSERVTKPSILKGRNEPQPPRRCQKWWISGACIFGIIIIALLGVVLMKQMDIANGYALSQKTNEMKPPESCLELRQRGVHTTGIHRIQLSEETVPIEVFCDMEIDGGGWSLVASIHEDDINAKCSTGDRWSDYVPDVNGYKDKTSWENEMTFGEVRRSLLDDYKSCAYHRMQASNVMIWKVPSGLSVNLAKNHSRVSYRTDNNFLRSYGGNMKTLFNRYFPLTPQLPADSKRMGNLLRAVIRGFSSISYQVRDWYYYKVNEGHATISDDAMYTSWGNRISFYRDSSSTFSLRYGSEYRTIAGSETFAATDGTSTPFTFLAAIFNDIQQTESFRIAVTSYRSSSGSVMSKFENTSSLGNFSLHYHAVQFYDPDEKLSTECRLHFYIANEREWKSILPSRFFNSTRRVSSTSNYKRLGYEISGRPSRVLFGYMLLSKKSGKNYTSTELDKVAALILKTVSRYTNLMDAWTEVSTLSVPVTFDRGTETDIMESIPANMRTLVKGGYIQFRAPNYSGFSNALCPGVSLNTTSPEYVCVGGLSNSIQSSGTCGDFAGWGGAFKRYYKSRKIGGYAHSSADISSTFLIFYR